MKKPFKFVCPACLSRYTFVWIDRRHPPVCHFCGVPLVEEEVMEYEGKD